MKLLRLGIFMALAAFVAALTVFTASPRRLFGNGSGWFQMPCDFELRYNEVKCLRQGVDPFDVWSGDIILKPFIPHWGEAREALLGEEGYTEKVNAYAPWEYTVMLPLSYLPARVAAAIYFFIMLGALGVLFWAGLEAFGRRAGGAAFSALAILLVALPALQDFISGNLAVITLAGAAFMVVSLNRNREILAGLGWAVAMLKPQLGLIFAIPLLMRRKWLTCFTAASICAALTIPAAIIGKVSPLKLILETPAANTFAFNGSGTAPYFLLSLLPRAVVINMGLVIGAAICLALTCISGKANRAATGEYKRDWFYYMMPAAVCAMSWSYSQCYCHVFAWFFFVVLIAEIARRPKSRFLWSIAAISLFSMTRVYNCAHIVMEMTGLFGEGGMSEALHYTIDSLNSTLDLALCAAVAAAKPRLKGWKVESRRNFRGGG